MSTPFFLFLPVRNNQETDLASLTLSWVYEDINNDLKLGHGLLSDVATAAVQKDITIVVPGEDVLFLTAEVPGKNIQRIQQAIPYVLEDRVIDDVDALYFAIKKSTSDNLDNKYDVSIINQHYFETVIKQLEKAGVYADKMIADYFLLAEDTSLFFDGKRLLFNNSEIKFSSAIDSTLFLGDESFNKDKSLKLINCDKADVENIELIKLKESLDVTEEQCELHPLVYLVKNRSNSNVNLLQGTYKKKKDWSKTGKRWLPVTILFTVWLLVQGSLFILDYISLNKQNKSLNSEITKIYKKTFPKSRKIIDAKAQMQQKLTALQKRKGQSGRSFTEMLSNSASIFSSSKGLKIKSLRYYDGRINLEIEIASLQALDKLKDRLSKEKGYQVDIQNASSGKTLVTARIQILGAE